MRCRATIELGGKDGELWAVWCRLDDGHADRHEGTFGDGNLLIWPEVTRG